MRATALGRRGLVSRPETGKGGGRNWQIEWGADAVKGGEELTEESLRKGKRAGRGGMGAAPCLASSQSNEFPSDSVDEISWKNGKNGPQF